MSEEVTREEFEELDRNGSLVYVENKETGDRDWVDSRDVDGWEC